MFKKISKKRPSMVVAEAKWYVVARDKEKHNDWALNSMERLSNITDRALERDSVLQQRQDRPEDVITIVESIEKQDCSASALVMLTTGGDRPWTNIPYDVAFCQGQRCIAVTNNGRPFTEDEREELLEQIREAFCQMANSVGAICMQMNLDGKISTWYDDESCYDACEIPRETMAQFSHADAFNRALKQSGIDAKELGAARSLANIFNDEIIEMLGDELDNSNRTTLAALRELNDMLDKLDDYIK